MGTHRRVNKMYILNSEPHEKLFYLQEKHNFFDFCL